MSEKKKRKNCAPEVLEEARKLIERGQSKRSVAEALGMPESTLRKRLKRDEPATKLGRFETTFSDKVEADFCDYLKLLDDMYFGMTAKRLRELAFEYAVTNKIPHRFNIDTKLAGKGWLRGFLRRHPDISLRQPTSTSIARAMAFNRPQVERFYINLTAVQDRYSLPPHRIFNMDETGITTVPNKPPKVLSTKGKRSVSKISSAERGVNITVVNAMSASGIYVPPTFIFGRKRMKAELLDGAPSGTIGMVSDTSYMNSELFLEWLTHFKDHTKPSKENPVLLILDNHVSHCTISAINFYRDNHIIALTLPPHTSHKMQPLDCGFHTVLKKYFSNECEKWLRNHPGRAITVFQMVGIFTPAYLKAATLACAVQSFKVTGIVPYDPDVFTEADFLASAVTEKERDEGTIERATIVPLTNTGSSKEPQPIKQSLVDKECVNNNAGSANDVLPLLDFGVSIVSEPPLHSTPVSPSILIDSVHDEGSIETSAISIENITTAPESPSQPPEIFTVNVDPAPCVSAANVNSNFKSVTDIWPIPKAEKRTVSKRKHKKSDIISSSPYKIEVEKQEAQKKPKPKLALNSSERSKPNKKRQQFKKPNTCPRKKNWRCGGCHEVYKEPIVEDWIECKTCKEWWHEKCTDYMGRGFYKCDLCTQK